MSELLENEQDEIQVKLTEDLTEAVELVLNDTYGNDLSGLTVEITSHEVNEEDGHNHVELAIDFYTPVGEGESDYEDLPDEED